MINIFNDWDEDADQLSIFKETLAHQKQHKSYKIQILVENGETIREKLLEVKLYDFMYMYDYAHDNNLTHETGCKWTKKLQET